jgi:hypothetical protein
MVLSKAEMVLCRGALEALESVGPSGLSETALVRQAALYSEGGILTHVQERALMSILVDKSWISCYTDPLTGVKRWWLTDDGRLALRAM